MTGKIIHNNQLAQNIEAAWADLEACLAGLSEKQLTQICDTRGWSVKDHLTHIIAWEEVLLMLFMDKPVEETLRIPPDKYTIFDDVNEDIRNQWTVFSLDIVLEKLHNIHHQLMAKISPLSEEDLQQPVVKFFSTVPAKEKRNMSEFIQAHTDNHYRDHVAWINKLVASPE